MWERILSSVCSNGSLFSSFFPKRPLNNPFIAPPIASPTPLATLSTAIEAV